MHIVNGQQMCPDRLLGSEMIDVRAGHAQTTRFFGPARCTRTALLDRRKVLGVPRVFEIEHAAGSDGISESLFRMKVSKDVDGGLFHSVVCESKDVGNGLTAVLVGQTQSNISAPRATATTMSSG
jgi:hypothetical protein